MVWQRVGWRWEDHRWKTIQESDELISQLFNTQLYMYHAVDHLFSGIHETSVSVDDPIYFVSRFRSRFRRNVGPKGIMCLLSTLCYNSYIILHCCANCMKRPSATCVLLSMIGCRIMTHWNLSIRAWGHPVEAQVFVLIQIVCWASKSIKQCSRTAAHVGPYRHHWTPTDTIVSWEYSE